MSYFYDRVFILWKLNHSTFKNMMSCLCVFVARFLKGFIKKVNWVNDSPFLPSMPIMLCTFFIYPKTIIDSFTDYGLGILFKGEGRKHHQTKHFPIGLSSVLENWKERGLLDLWRLVHPTDIWWSGYYWEDYGGQVKDFHQIKSI